MEENIDEFVDKLLDNYTVEMYNNPNYDETTKIKFFEITDELLKKYECSICELEDIRNINKIIFVCGHHMCENCVNKILKINEPKCPYCRKCIKSLKI